MYSQVTRKGVVGMLRVSNFATRLCPPNKRVIVQGEYKETRFHSDIYVSSPDILTRIGSLVRNVPDDIYTNKQPIEMIEERYSEIEPLLNNTFRSLDRVLDDMKKPLEEQARELVFKIAPHLITGTYIVGQDINNCKTRLNTLEYKRTIRISSDGIPRDSPIVACTSIVTHAILSHAAGLHSYESILPFIIAQMSPTSSLYQVCAPFMYNELVSSRAAQDTLCHPRGIFPNMFGFTGEGFVDAFSLHVKPLPAFIETYNRQTDDVKRIMYYDEGIRLWNILKEYLERTVDSKDWNLLKSKLGDNPMIKVLDHIHKGIWLHQFIGNTMFDLQANPLLSATKLYYSNANISDYESYCLTTMIGAGTTFRHVPLLMNTNLDNKLTQDLYDWNIEARSRCLDRQNGLNSYPDRYIDYTAQLPENCSTGLHQ